MTEKITLYQPSNGSEGEWFMGQFCYQCSKMPINCDAKNQCMIQLSTFAWNIEDKEYPKEWRYVDGEPTCTAFVDREEANSKRRQSRGKLKPNSNTDNLDFFTD